MSNFGGKAAWSLALTVVLQLAALQAAEPESADKAALQMDPKGIHLQATFTGQRPMFACRFDDAGEQIFTGIEGNEIQRWNLSTEEHTELKGQSSWVRRLDYFSTGDLLVAGDYAGNLICWESASSTPRIRWELDAHRGYVRAVAISPDGQYVATGGNDNLVKIWSLTDGLLIRQISGHERHVYNAAFHPSGEWLVTGDLTGILKQWEVGTWRHVRDIDAKVLCKYDKTFRADCGGIRGIDFNHDGTQLVVCGVTDVTNAFAGIGTPAAVLFDWESGEQLKLMKSEKAGIGACWSVRFHPSGEYVVGTGGRTAGKLWFWKLDEEQPFLEFALPNVGYDIAMHPDTYRLAVAVYDKTVRIYDLRPEVKSKDEAEKKDDGQKKGSVKKVEKAAKK